MKDRFSTTDFTPQLPFWANILSNARIPLELRVLVYVGASLGWNLPETFSRPAWRHQTHPGIGP